MVDNNCIFCKIANGEIPSKTLYEDEECRVILDLAPATKGHALILPKSHSKNLYELPEETAGKVMMLAKKMATTMAEKLGCDGFNVVQNNNEVAGQTVFHFHMHLIPRYENDNQKIAWNPTEMTQDELEAVKNQITEYSEYKNTTPFDELGRGFVYYAFFTSFSIKSTIVAMELR